MVNHNFHLIQMNLIYYYLIVKNVLQNNILILQIHLLF
jgi:hypothetical protein